MSRSHQFSQVFGVLLFGSGFLAHESIALAQGAPPNPMNTDTPAPAVPEPVTPARNSPSPAAQSAPTPDALNASNPAAPSTPSTAPTPYAPPSVNPNATASIATSPMSDAPPPPALRDNPNARVRLELGGRVGYAVPYGHVASDRNLKDIFSGSIPGVFDVWARLPSGLSLGLYVGLAAGLSGPALDSCPSCTALNYRLGLQGAQHFNPGGSVDPWVGLGVGGEWASITEHERLSGVDYTFDNTFTAIPELTAQMGIDIGGDTIAFGPFVSVSYASYGKVTSTASCSALNCGNGDRSSTSVDGGGHGWLSLGLRGTYLK